EGTAGTWPGPGDNWPLELKPVLAIGPSTAVPRTVLVAAEMATTRPSRWSSSVSWAAVLPGRSWLKNRATKIVSSVSSASPSLVPVMARGEVAEALRSTVATTALVAVLITDSELEAALATYNRVPLGDRATAIGSAPTVTVLLTDSVCKFTTETVPLNELAT